MIIQPYSATECDKGIEKQMDADMPFLSIITINRNNAAGLRRTIQSVFDATDCFSKGKVEYIIIDGASSDGSVDVILNAVQSEKGKELISFWCSESDGGIYSAMNKGIRHSSGKLIGIMNSGDSYLQDALTGLEKAHESDPDAILYGIGKWCKNDEFSGKLFFNDAKRLPYSMIVHEGSFVPLSIYKKYGLYDESFKIAGDWDRFLSFYLSGVKFIFIGRVVYNFNTGGISSTPFVKIENKIVLQKHNLYKPVILSKKQKLKISLKKVIKIFIPYGVLRAYSILLKAYRKGKVGGGQDNIILAFTAGSILHCSISLAEYVLDKWRSGNVSKHGQTFFVCYHDKPQQRGRITENDRERAVARVYS